MGLRVRERTPGCLGATGTLEKRRGFSVRLKMSAQNIPLPALLPLQDIAPSKYLGIQAPSSSFPETSQSRLSPSSHSTVVAGRRLGGGGARAGPGREAGNRAACPDGCMPPSWGVPTLQAGRCAAQLAGQVGGTPSRPRGAWGPGTWGLTFLSLQGLGVHTQVLCCS